jgi:ATP adenylyltransferase
MTQQRLWAPWQLKYVQGEREDSGCIFCLAADTFNLGVNEGEVAGAGFAGHVYLHVVPRWRADSNFMAVTGDTRVLPQSLEDSYAALRERFGG